MLERAVGPQAAAAIVLFGEPSTAPGPSEIGLAWRCLPDDELVAAARDLAARAAKVPKPLLAAAKQTLARCRGSPTSTRARHRDRAPDLVARPGLVPRPT